MKLKMAATVASLTLSLSAIATGAHAADVPFLAGIPTGSTLLSQITTPYSVTASGETITGNLYSAVFSSSTGGRDFYYQFEVTSATAPITTLSLSNFTGYSPTFFQLNGVDIDGGGPFTTGGEAATDVTVLSGTAYFSFNAIATGGKSDVLLARTNATNFGTGNGAVIAGAAANAQIIAPAGPVVVPEAGTMALLGSGALGVVGMVVRRRKVA